MISTGKRWPLYNDDSAASTNAGWPPLTKPTEHSSPINLTMPSRLRAMRGLKQLRCVQVITAGHAFIQNIRRGHYELGAEETVNLRVRAAFDELVMAI